MTLPRLYPILDTGTLERRGFPDWAAIARGMLEGGAGILQLRHKEQWTRSAFERAEAVARECERHGVGLIVNDRADVARMLGAGVHVGQEDLSPADCRRVLGPEAVVGYSTHSLQQLAAAEREPVTYAAFGPVFATVSKARPDPVVALTGLAQAKAAAGKPLVAIGGITRLTARAVLDTGVDSLASIGDLLPETLTELTVRERMEEWQRLIRR